VLEVKGLTGVWVVAAAASFGSELIAQDGDAQAKKEKPVTQRRFFDRPIDYWGRGLGFEEDSKGTDKDPKHPEVGPGQKAQASEWGQVVKLPDGTLSYHELPQPLVDVLENPTPENIRAYFAFRMSKTQKILRAAELMKEYRASLMGRAGENAPPAPGDPPPTGETAAAAQEKTLPAAPAQNPAAPPPFTVTYFHKKHCPHCDTQDVILADWLRDKPEAKLEVIEFGARPELWRAYQVRGTPTLLLEDTASKQTVILEGLQRSDVLDRKLGECRAAGSRERAVKGEE